MANEQRLDLDTIVNLVPPQSRVLDLGCGDGALLQRLVQEKQVEARGVEISESKVRAAIGRGVSVRHGNIEEGLADYLDDAFDYVVLSQTLAYLNKPAPVVRDGKHAIISFDNAGHWRARWRALRGHGMGFTLTSGEPRARAITLAQFREFAASVNGRIEQSVLLARKQCLCCSSSLCAWCSEVAVFMLTRVT